MSMTVLVRLARNGLGNPNIQFYCLFITPINVRTCTALSFHKNVGVKEMETIYYFTVIHIYFLVTLKPKDKFYNVMNFINFAKQQKVSKDYGVQVFIGNIRLESRNKLI